MRVSLFPFLKPKQQETHAGVHPNLLSSSLKQQESPGFEVLQRRSLCHHICTCSHVSREIVLHLNRKLPCFKNMGFHEKNSYRHRCYFFGVFFIHQYICHLMLYFLIYRYKFNMIYGIDLSFQYSLTIL